MDAPTQLLIALAGAVLNAAATWGVVSTKLAWLRRDLNEVMDRIDALEGRHVLLRRPRDTP
jgi:hypothetical protein